MLYVYLTNRTKLQIIINKLSFGEISFAVRNIIRCFANNKRKEKRKMIQKKYSEEAGADGPLCQGNGTSGAYGYPSVSGPSGKLFLWRYPRGTAHSQATVSQHLKELKDAGLIQEEIEAPKVKYCINRENWEIARRMFADFFGQPLCKKEGCCR